MMGVDRDDRGRVLDYASPRKGLEPNPVATAGLICAVVGVAVFFLVVERDFAPMALLGRGVPLVMGAAAIVIGRKGDLRSREPGGSGRFRADMAILMGIGCVVLVGVDQCLPRLVQYREPANRVKCASDLRQIGQGIQLWAVEHGGKLPARLDQLITEADLNPEVFVCPSSDDTKAEGVDMAAVMADFGRAGRCSHVYLGAGMQGAISRDVVWAYERADHHGVVGRNFLFGDGRVEWIEGKKAERMVKELEAGVNPPRGK